MRSAVLSLTTLLALLGCSPEAGSKATTDAPATLEARTKAGLPFVATPVATLDQPWAMRFLPDGRMLVTEKAGKLRIVTRDGVISAPLAGVPKVDDRGQGGLADIVLHPDFANRPLVYLSYAEPGPDGTAGLAVGRGRLTEAGLEDFTVLWRQEPKVVGEGHYSGKMAFDRDGYLFIAAGERQKFTPAQDMTQSLGKIIRLSEAGGIPSTNPFYDQGSRVRATIWSFGHRNLLGLAFDGAGKLWEVEMGPRHGDELNLVEPGRNYGWPLVSNGDHYDGRDIPDHATRPEFEAPKVSWVPAISPSSLMIYSGALFPQWQGSAFIGGLSSKALVRVAFEGTMAREVERFSMGARIRDVQQGPDGAIWLLEDGESGGRLLKLTPVVK